MQALDHEARQITQAIQQEAFRPTSQIARLGRLRPVAAISALELRASFRLIIDGNRPSSLVIDRSERPDS